MRFTLFIAFLYMLNVQTAKEKLVAVCKHGNEIKIDYMDSMKGIVGIQKSIHADTLELTIDVAKVHKSKSYEIPISSKIRFIRYGSTIKEISKLPECSTAKVLSGKDALKYMEHDQQPSRENNGNGGYWSSRDSGNVHFFEDQQDAFGYITDLIDFGGGGWGGAFTKDYDTANRNFVEGRDTRARAELL